METLGKLRHMVHREGVSVREAARRLRISRNTAAHWLSKPETVEPRYPQRAASPGLLGAYEDHLERWLKADSLRGKNDRRSVGAYFECLRAMGFAGSKSLVYNYCRSWKQQQDNALPDACLVPLSIELGEAFRSDWSEGGLTAREWEVLAWIGRGRSCREIATLMGIAPFTVRKHRCNILGKSGLHSTAQLVAFAIRTLQPYGDVRDRSVLSRLSERERHVVALVAQGLTSKEIARRLNISPATVSKHRENAMKSLRVRGMASLMWHAIGLDDA